MDDSGAGVNVDRLVCSMHVAETLNKRKTLLLFIYGLGADARQTWGDFPTILQSDRCFASLNEIGFFSYPTMLIRTFFAKKALAIQELAAGLRTQLENRYDGFENVILAGHSLGGLIARKYVVEELKLKRPLRVKGMILFAVPNNGAEVAGIASLFSWRHRHLEQLDRDSDFIESLNGDWQATEASAAFKSTYVVGSQDGYVKRSSAIMFWGNPNVETILDKGHSDLVKPKNENDDVVLILKRFAATVNDGTGNLVSSDRETSSSFNHLQSSTEIRSVSALPDRSTQAALTKPVAIVCGSLALAFLLAIAYNHYRRIQDLALRRPTIVLANLTNSTGDVVFNDTLRQALSWKLMESPAWTVLSDEQMNSTLRRMNRPAGIPITKDVGRDICQRNGLNFVVSGAIAQIEATYILTLEATDCETGDSLGGVQAEARSKALVLTSLGKASADLRRKLGESIDSVKRFDKPFEATTSSLEALKAYTLSKKAVLEGNISGEVALLQNAIDLDPTFAYAYAALSAVYGNLQQTETAKQFSEKAFSLRNHVTQREKFYISSIYYRSVTGQLKESIKTTNQWALTYPQDYRAFTSLGAAYGDAGESEKAITASQKATRLNPDSVEAYGNLMMISIALNEFDKARQYYNDARQNFEPPFYFSLLAFDLAFVRHDKTAMEVAAKEAVNKDGEQQIYFREALSEAYYGRLRSARDLFRRSSEAAERNRSREGVGLANAELGHIEMLFENRDAALRSSIAAIQQDDSLDTITLAGWTFALAGDEVRADQISNQLQRRFPSNDIVQDATLPDLRAALMLEKGNYDQAIQDLRVAASYENVTFSSTRVMYSAYLRGEAYLKAKRWPEAKIEFQKVVDHAGLMLYSPISVLARLGLAKACHAERETGNCETFYQDVLNTWSNADEDVPLINRTKNHLLDSK